MQNWNENDCFTVYVATDAELSNIVYYHNLWVAVRSVEIPRRDWLDELSNCFRDHEVVLLSHADENFDLPDIDDVFDDSGMRWISEFIRADSSGTKPKVKSRQYGRLRLLDLYFRVQQQTI